MERSESRRGHWITAAWAISMISLGLSPMEAQEPEFLRGDFNSSGAVDISDPIGTLDYLFMGKGFPPCEDAADSDDSGFLDITDSLYTLDYLFLGGNEPPAPGAITCGPDGRDDELGCDAPVPCGGISEPGDPDGDGLDTEQELAGWRIFVDEQGLGQMEAREVSSDPTLADTDGDGLSDREESLLLTDPRRADTDGDGLSDLEELERWQTNPSSVDTDGDARGPAGTLFPSSRFFDGLELELLGTSPSLADTDGDGKTDFEEHGDPIRHPLVAELPEVSVNFEGDLDVRLNVVFEDSNEQGVEFGSSLAQSQTSSQSRTDTASDRWTAGSSVTVGAEYEFGLTGGATVSAEATAYAEYGQERSTALTRESSRTAQQEHSRYQSRSSTSTEIAASGSISAGVRIENPGVFTYELRNLALAILQWTPAPAGSDEAGTFRTVGTLVADLTAGDVGKTLAPGDRTEILQLSARDVDPTLVKEFLRDPTTLHFDTTGFELLSGDSINFKFLTEQTFARTALIVIDPGNGEVERFRVATNVARGAGGSFEGISMRAALEDVIGIPYETSESPVQPGVTTLKRVRDTDTIPATTGTLPVGAWTVFTTASDQVSRDRSFEDIVIRHGDVVRLVYLRDEDQDGLIDRHESLLGTSDQEVDSDLDGISDREEVATEWVVRIGDRERTVRPSPRFADVDGDGLVDLDEMVRGTDPRSADTDGDGESDDREIEIGTDPLEYDDFTALHGELVSRIEANYRSAIDQVEDRLVAEVEARYRNAELNHERMKRLAEVGAVSQAHVNAARVERDEVRAELVALEDEISEARALLDDLPPLVDPTIETFHRVDRFFSGWIPRMNERGLVTAPVLSPLTEARRGLEELEERT